MMGKHRLGLVPGIEISQPLENSNVVQMGDYKPELPSRTMSARTRIDESIEEAKVIAETMKTFQFKKPTRQIIDEMGLWLGVPETLSLSAREEILYRAVEESNIPEAWRQEAIRQLENIESDVIHGEA